METCGLDSFTQRPKMTIAAQPVEIEDASADAHTQMNLVRGYESAIGEILERESASRLVRGGDPTAATRIRVLHMIHPRALLSSIGSVNEHEPNPPKKFGRAAVSCAVVSWQSRPIRKSASNENG